MLISKWKNKSMAACMGLLHPDLPARLNPLGVKKHCHKNSPTTQFPNYKKIFS